MNFKTMANAEVKMFIWMAVFYICMIVVLQLTGAIVHVSCLPTVGSTSNGNIKRLLFWMALGR